MGSESTALVEVGELNALEVFTVSGVDPLLKRIMETARAHKPDTTTAKGRKEIASLAHKVARSKTLLDSMGKDLVSDWKQKAKVVDEARKQVRDTLDMLKEEVRQPLTEWEDAEASRIAAEKLAAEVESAHLDALKEHDLWLRQKEIEAKEAEFARQEEERRRKAEAERLEKERLERERRIRLEAAEIARREAEAASEKAKAESARREAEAREAAAKAERDRLEAIEKARLEKEHAVERERLKAKEEAEQKERERLESERIEFEKAKRIAADKKHRAEVNRGILRALSDAGIGDDDGKKIITLAAKGKIPNLIITY